MKSYNFGGFITYAPQGSYLAQQMDIFANPQKRMGLNAAERKIFEKYTQRRITMDQAQRALDALVYSNAMPGNLRAGGAQEAGALELLRNNKLVISDMRSQISNVKIQGGEVTATITLMPSKDLKGIIKPTKIGIKVPTSLWQHAAPPPTSRGKPTDKRH
jgi:hypothetical protein